MQRATYSISTICKMLDLTDRRVQQLAKEGIIPKAERGKYDLVQCVRAYIHYLREKALGNDSGLEGALWRERMVKANALKAEMELDEMKKDLVRVERVERYLDKLFTAIKQHILAMPSKVSPMVVSEDSEEGVKLVLEGEARDILNLIADYEIDDDEDDGEPNDSLPDSQITEQGKTTEKADGNGVGK